MILKVLPLGAFQTNCYLVGSEKTKEGLVIDPGSDSLAILDQIRRLGLEVKLIVNTHAHLDHVLAIESLKRTLGIKFALHADDVPILEQVPSNAVMWFGRPVDPIPPPDILLKDGDVLEVGDIKLTVIHTPGHSPGGICLHTDGMVFSGDTLFNFGIGRTDFPGGSYEQLLHSIATRLLTLPDDTVVLPGHGPDTTIGEERRANPFLQGYSPPG
jgi:glyoxylase-like metal-dependent hydrolase (beta-lactamase superfamily II)